MKTSKQGKQQGNQAKKLLYRMPFQDLLNNEMNRFNVAFSSILLYGWQGDCVGIQSVQRLGTMPSLIMSLSTQPAVSSQLIFQHGEVKGAP